MPLAVFNSMPTRRKSSGSVRIKKLRDHELSVRVGPEKIIPVKVVRDLGVQLDEELSMKAHVAKVSSACYYTVLPASAAPDTPVTTQLVLALVMSRLDYCNAVVASVPQSTLEPLQRVQNAAPMLSRSSAGRSRPRHVLVSTIDCVHDHVPNTHWQMPGVSRRHHQYVQQRSNTYWPAIGFQQQVHDATAENQVWRTRLFTCRTGSMEFTAT